MRRLPLVHPGFAALVDDTTAVAHDDVFVGDAKALDQLRTCDRRCAGAVDHHLDVGYVALGHVYGIDQPGSGDNCGAVLVVMKDRNIHQLAQALLDDEAFRRLDILQVDAAPAFSQQLHAVDKGVGIAGIDLDIHGIHVGKALEQHRLAFHHRLGGQRTDIAEAKYGRPVGDYRDQIAFRRVVVGKRLVFLDLQARGCDARRIGQRQMVLRRQRLGRHDLDLARPAGFVHAQRFLVER